MTARRITVVAYEQDNVTLAVPGDLAASTLTSDKGRQWLDDLSAEGSYQIESHLDTADRALLADTRVLRFCMDGTARWAGLVGNLNLKLADPTLRRAGRTVGAAGVGLLAIFDDAAVLPELGFGRISPDTRHMGWMSRYYDHTGWGNAVELKQQNDPDATKPWFGAPRPWADGDAYWVGPTDGDVPGANPGGGLPGDMYLWGTYTVAVGAGGDYLAELTADDAWHLWRDGDLEAEESKVGLWGVGRQVAMQLDEGSHFFAVKVTNFDRPDNSTNVFGFILSLAKMLGGGLTRGTVVARSSAGTKMLAFPAAEPGMTPGAILLAFIAENQDLGWHTDLTCSFTGTVDSAGTAWPTEINRAYQVGSSLLEVLNEMRDSHLAEFAMDPVGKVLHAWVQKGADLHSPVTVAVASNVNGLATSHTGPSKNTGIARTAEGRWVMYEDSGAVSSYGRRMVGLSLGAAPSDGSADQQTTAFLADHANPIDAHTDLQVEDSRFVDGTVVTGDRVTGPLESGSATFRVHALRFTEDDAGQPIVTPEMVKQ